MLVLVPLPYYNPGDTLRDFQRCLTDAFGYHGRLQDGEECVLGIKLTGDQNVPAGHVSFRAKIGRKHRRSGYDLMYPPELEISARYAGEGRVAHKGFRDARSVTEPSFHSAFPGSCLTLWKLFIRFQAPGMISFLDTLISRFSASV